MTYHHPHDLSIHQVDQLLAAHERERSRVKLAAKDAAVKREFMDNLNVGKTNGGQDVAVYLPVCVCVHFCVPSCDNCTARR